MDDCSGFPTLSLVLMYVRIGHHWRCFIQLPQRSKLEAQLNLSLGFYPQETELQDVLQEKNRLSLELLTHSQKAVQYDQVRVGSTVLYGSNIGALPQFVTAWQLPWADSSGTLHFHRSLAPWEHSGIYDACVHRMTAASSLNSLLFKLIFQKA